MLDDERALSLSPLSGDFAHYLEWNSAVFQKIDAAFLSPLSGNFMHYLEWNSVAIPIFEVIKLLRSSYAFPVLWVINTVIWL